MSELVDGIELQEVVIPVVCFATCLSFQAWEFLRHDLGPKTRARALFKSVRAGWVTDNYMKGQAAVNTTRDYIRASVFFANTAIVLTTFIVGFAGTMYTDCSDGGCEPRDWLLVAKLGVLASVLLIIFFVFTQCTRFAVHFSFCINTSELDGVPMPHSLLVKVFDHAHTYWSLGIRLYFGTIPVFAWIFASWALLGVTPVYIYMVRGLEDANFAEDELEELKRQQEAQIDPPASRANAAVADVITATASAAGAVAAATGEKQHIV